MLNFAHEVSTLLHNLGHLDTLAIKVASVEDSQDLQTTTAIGSDKLYNVIYKKAEEVMPEGPAHWQFTTFIDKLAMLLGKPEMTEEQTLKLGSAVAVDVALSSVMETNNISKYAEARAYGREYIMELLRGIL